MTLNSLAKGITSSSYLSKLENGAVVPSSDILIALAKRLELPSSFILDDANEDPQLLLMLKQLFQYSILEVEKTASIIELIDENYHTNLASPRMEFYYLVLKCIVLLKTKQTEACESIHKDYIIPYLDSVDIESLSNDFRCAIYYYFGYYQFVQSNYKDCIEYLYRLHEVVDNLEIKASVIYNTGILNKRLGRYQDAIISTKKAIEYLKELSFSYLLALAHNLLGDLYREKSLYKEAITELEEAKRIAEEHSYTKTIGIVYHNLGLVSKESGDYKQGITYCYEALKVKEQSDKSGILITYRLLIDCKLCEENIEKAKELYEIARTLEQSEDDRWKLLYHYNEYYKLTNDFAEYEKNLKGFLSYLEKVNDFSYEVDCHRKLAKYYLNTGKYKKSAVHYKNALAILDKKL
nr:helix-turn-helix transcriptional regulator [Aquibacillus koreensis]